MDGDGNVARCNAKELLEKGFVVTEFICDAKVRAGFGSPSDPSGRPLVRPVQQYRLTDMVSMICVICVLHTDFGGRTSGNLTYIRRALELW